MITLTMAMITLTMAMITLTMAMITLAKVMLTFTTVKITFTVSLVMITFMMVMFTTTPTMNMWLRLTAVRLLSLMPSCRTLVESPSSSKVDSTNHNCLSACLRIHR